MRPLIDAHPALQPPGASAPHRQHQVTTYFDTPGLALAGAGLTLRVRRIGDRRTQTVKSANSRAGVAMQRGEWEWPIESDRPEFGRLLGIAGGSLESGLADRLSPIFVTDVERTIRTVRLDAGTVIEAAIDSGEIRSGDAAEAISEVELEAKSGPLGPLYRLALALQSTLPLRLGLEAKGARGVRLFTGRTPPWVEPAAPVLAPSVGAAKGFRQIVAAGLGDLLANQPAARAGDAEGVHQMRVALRRLRAALALFRPHLEGPAVAPFADELRRLGRVLGAARDWDVFCLEILPVAGADGLRFYADAARAASHARLADELDGTALTSLVLRIAVWLEDDSGLMPGRLRDMAPALLDRLARKVARRGRHIGKRTDEDLHALRKSLKKLSYGVEYLGGCASHKAVKDYLARCQALQKRLGAGNDAAVAMTLAKTLAREAGAPASAVAPVTRWYDRRRGRTRHRLAGAWDDFADTAPFWH